MTANLNTRQRINAIMSSATGNLVEWYDFYTYAFTSIYFASQFFPSNGNQTEEFLKAASVFFIGFLMRPLGGWFFGRLADTYGRKLSMLVSVFIMCAGSFLIAILPTYQSWGIAAPIFLLIIRMFQGLSVGGEYGTVATYMSEIAIKGRRGFFSSFQYVTLIGGQLLASLVVYILIILLGDEQMQQWGWRIPFIIGAFAAIVAFYLRRTLPESSTAITRAKSQTMGLRKLFGSYRNSMLLVICFTAGGSLSFYIFSVYMQKYLVTTTGLEKHTATMVMSAALFIFMLIQPIFGALADKIGTRASLRIWAFLLIFCTIPFLHLIGTASNAWIAFIELLVMLVIISFYTSISGIIKAEMFPAQIRALAVGFSYAIANAAFGGSAEPIALWLQNMGHASFFGYYATVIFCLAFFAAWIMPDARYSGYLQGNDDR